MVLTKAPVFGNVEISQPSKAMKWLFIAAAVLLLLVLCLPHDALAQTNTSTSANAGGDAAWTYAKNFMFSGWGLVISVLICLVAIYTIIKRSLGDGLVVLAVGFCLFLIPALVMGARNVGQSMAT